MRKQLDKESWVSTPHQLSWTVENRSPLDGMKYISVFLIDDLVTKVWTNLTYVYFPCRNIASCSVWMMRHATHRKSLESWDLVKSGTLLARKKREAVNRIIDFARNYSMKPALINPVLEQLGTTHCARDAN